MATKLNRFLQDCVLPRKLIELLRRASGSLYDAGDFSIDRSNAGERHALESLVSRLVTGPGYVIDIAASDGLSYASTAGLFSSLGWRGLAVEMEPVKFSSLASTYSQIAGASLAGTRITPSNASAVLQAFEVPANFSVLNLDIDSYDLRVLERLLLSEYRPAIITMEINEKIPPGVFFTVEFDENHFWKGDHFYGCSIDAACEVIRPFGYFLHSVEYNNAFFIRSDLATRDLDELPPGLAFERGYRNAPNRSAMFPYNSDVDHWLELEPGEAVEEIGLFFQQYSGMFTLRAT